MKRFVGPVVCGLLTFSLSAAWAGPTTGQFGHVVCRGGHPGELVVPMLCARPVTRRPGDDFVPPTMPVWLGELGVCLF